MDKKKAMIYSVISIFAVFGIVILFMLSTNKLGDILTNKDDIKKFITDMTTYQEKVDTNNLIDTKKESDKYYEYQDKMLKEYNIYDANDRIFKNIEIFENADALNWKTKDINITNVNKKENQDIVTFDVTLSITRYYNLPGDGSTMASTKEEVEHTFKNLVLIVDNTVAEKPVYKLEQLSNDRIGQFMLTWDRVTPLYPEYDSWKKELK